MKNNIPNYKAFSNTEKERKSDISINNKFSLISPKFSNKKAKRVGRGPSSKNGKTCGRGMKGQKARNTVKKGFEGGQMPLHRRLPKFGFKSHKKNKFSTINLYQLEKIQGDRISKKELLEYKLIPKIDSKVKLLGSGDMEKSLNIYVDAFSLSAKLKIEKAGGTCNIINK